MRFSVVAVVLLGCGPSPLSPSLRPLDPVRTTLDRTLSPATRRQRSPDNPAIPAVLSRALANGWGDTTEGPGTPHAARTFDGSPAPRLEPGVRPLVRFVHLADLQLIDDESPMRITSLDAAGFAAGAARPQEPHACRLANAAVRTINALHRQAPLDFVLLGGDNIDSAQANELDWLLGVLNGGRAVECDSGDDDDPVRGPANDGKDAFVSEGLAMPWRWVSGNHDELVQGLFAVNAEREAAAMGSDAAGGTRSGAGALLEPGSMTPADARRGLLTPKALLSRVGADGDGHGLTPAALERGKAFSSFDVPGTPLTFLLLDTAAESGGDDALLRGQDFDAFIEPVLARAASEGRVVLLAAHHATDRLTTNGGALGVAQADAMTPARVLERLAASGRVAFSLVGHSHTNRVVPVRVGAAGWWEVTTAAVIDFPNQVRVVEVFEQGEWVMLRGTIVDLDFTDDAVGLAGRRASVADLTSGWLAGDRLVGGTPEDQNVELWIRRR
ncbi:MAG: metallophosphoesterase [Myxococcaceae bacterium]|nr:metallophosphoesterase [Myxococcaceae bacterium]